MGKYDPLSRYLATHDKDRVPMTFAEIEAKIGSPLPKSATVYDAFWGNNPTGHVHADAWLKAGFETRDIDRARQTVIFERVRASLAARLEQAKALRKSGQLPETIDVVAMIREDRAR